MDKLGEKTEEDCPACKLSVGIGMYLNICKELDNRETCEELFDKVTTDQISPQELFDIVKEKAKDIPEKLDKSFLPLRHLINKRNALRIQPCYLPVERDLHQDRDPLFNTVFFHPVVTDIASIDHHAERYSQYSHHINSKLQVMEPERC